MSDPVSGPVVRLAELVGQLCDEVRTVEPVTRYRRVRRGDRDALSVELVDHRTRAPGLLHQLHAIASAASSVPLEVTVHHVDADTGEPVRDEHDRPVTHIERRRIRVPGVVITGAAVSSGSIGWDDDGALSPLVRGGTVDDALPAATELLDEIARGAATLVAEFGDRPRPTTTGTLRAVVGLAIDLDDDAAERMAERVRGWVATARILIGYDAPVIALRDIYCPACGGVMLVRTDASTAVWCGGRPATVVAGPARVGEDRPVVQPEQGPCGASWPRGWWLRLLAGDQSVPGETTV